MTARRTLLITGAGGFVGGAVVRRAAADGWLVRAASRRTVSNAAPNVQPIIAGDLARDADWSAALDGAEAVVHCAARVHVMNETVANPLSAFRAVNVAGSVRLASQAAAAGVRRFVHLSTLHVNGNETFERPFVPDDSPAPRSPYAVSKHEAELALAAVARESGLDLVVIRPPLVYGPGVVGNFAQLMRVVQRGVPLPFGTVCNQRSLVGLDNLVDLIVACLDHPQAANGTFLVSDGEDLSTPALLRRTAAALGVPARLLAVPPAALRALARLAGKAEAAQRLCGSLQVDISATRERLGWSPTFSVDAQLRRTAEHFLAGRHPR